MKLEDVTLRMLIHGESGVGKSWTGASSPAPRLILDAEGRGHYTVGRKVTWDPMVSPPPAYDGTWDTCIVTITDFQVVQLVFNWLASGQHPFVSVIIDSLMELQQRCIDRIVGDEQMQRDNWGELKRRIEGLMRSYRDLTMLAGNTVRCVILITGSKEDNGLMRPMLQGASGQSSPYYMDVVGYQYVAPSINPDGTAGPMQRTLCVEPGHGFVAKDGTDDLDPVYAVPNPKSGVLAVVEMMKTIAARRATPDANTDQEVVTA